MTQHQHNQIQLLPPTYLPLYFPPNQPPGPRTPYHYLRPEIIERLGSDPFDGTEKQATRHSYAEAIIEVGERYENVVVLDADVSNSINTTHFAERFPERNSISASPSRT